MNAIAFTVKDWRARHDVTQTQAGLLIGCRRETISHWECGDCKPGRTVFVETLGSNVPADRVAEVKEMTERERAVNRSEFAAAIKQWRRGHRLTQSQAGAALQTTARTIWCWETERALPWNAVSILQTLPTLSPSKPKPLITARRFGRLLRAWRKRSGFNQLEACIALDLPHDQALVSNWEKAKSTPRQPRLSRMLAIIKNSR